MKRNATPYLGREVGDRILLGALSLAMIIVFGCSALVFLKSDLGTILTAMGFEFCFVAAILSIMGLVWAIATPAFIEEIIAKQMLKVYLISVLVLVGVIFMFIYSFI